MPAEGKGDPQHQTVVVTHHAPHPDCLPDPDFDLGWRYASDLSRVIEQTKPVLWIRGHLHGPVNVQVGETRILANARAHACKPSVKVFDPALVVEVEELTPVPGFA